MDNNNRNFTICRNCGMTEGRHADNCRAIAYTIEYKVVEDGVWLDYTHTVNSRNELESFLNIIIPKVAQLVAIITRVYVA